jgi:hypothetical protein
MASSGRSGALLLRPTSARPYDSTPFHSQTRSILRQRLTIAAAARAGIDPAFDKTFLAAMERNLAELNTWRRHLLDKLDADLP